MDAANSGENTEKKPLSPALEANKWKPGQSGNPSGRPKKRLLDEVLTELLELADSSDAIEVAKALIGKAKSGDAIAAKLIAERTQGKPTQKVEHTGKDGEPISIGVRFI